MVAKDFHYDLNLLKNEIQNGVIQNLSVAPNNPKQGQFYFNTVDKTLYVYADGNWVNALSQGKVYTEGLGIDISGETISVDTTVIAQKTDIPTNYVPNTRTVNGQPLSADVTLDAEDVGALPEDTFIPTISDIYNSTSFDGMSGKAVASALADYVPKTTSVNGHELTGDIELDAEDVGALADTTKYGATLSFTVDSSTYILTAQLKDQNGNVLGTSQTVDLPLESVVVDATYDKSKKAIVLELQSGSTTDVPVGDIVAGLQSEITAANKLNSDLVDDTTSANKFVTNAQRTQIGTNATDIGEIKTTLSGYGNIVTHNVNEFATAAQGALAETALQEIISSDVTEALGYTPAQTIAVNNTTLTVNSGIVTWTITNTIGKADVVVQVREVATNAIVEVVQEVTANTITIKMNADENIAADTYRAVIIG